MDKIEIILAVLLNTNHMQIISTTREIYIKGPGLSLPRPSKKFITEIQILTKNNQYCRRL